jgi:hypothetical protein
MFLYQLLICVGLLFVFLDGHVITTNIMISKYNKLKQLTSVVSTQHTNIYIIMYVSFCMILKALYINMCQYCNKTVVKIDKYTYEITYILCGHMYTIRIKPPRGPKYVMMVIDENGQDVSDMVMPYIGPESNFHGNTFNSISFNRDSLRFELFDGTSLKFENIEIIDLINKISKDDITSHHINKNQPLTTTTN